MLCFGEVAGERQRCRRPQGHAVRSAIRAL